MLMMDLGKGVTLNLSSPISFKSGAFLLVVSVKESTIPARVLAPP